MREWIASGGGAQDLLDDTQLYNSVQAFLDSSTDHIVHKALAFEEPVVQQAWSNLGEGRAELRSCFVEQTKRPTLFDKVLTTHVRGGANGGAGRGVRTRHSAPREPPEFDRMDPEDFVDNLDGMVCAAFCNVTEEVRPSFYTHTLLHWLTERFVPTLPAFRTCTSPLIFSKSKVLTRRGGSRHGNQRVPTKGLKSNAYTRTFRKLNRLP